MTTTRKLPASRQLYYGGGWHDAESGRAMPVTSPSTGEDLGVTAEGDATDVDRAVVAAEAAFRPWADAPARERASCVRAAAQVGSGAPPRLIDGNVGCSVVPARRSCDIGPGVVCGRSQIENGGAATEIG